MVQSVTSIIDLKRIPDDRYWGVICETEEELREFVSAVKTQCKNIDVGIFANSSEISKEYYRGKAFFINYSNSGRIQYGDVVTLPSNLKTMRFDELFPVQDLPDISEDQLGALSMLGL